MFILSLINNHMLIVYIAKPCNEVGEYLPRYTCPPALPNALDGGTPELWSPFISRLEFDFADYHFVEVQSFTGLINKALDLWAATVVEVDGAALWKNSKE